MGLGHRPPKSGGVQHVAAAQLAVSKHEAALALPSSMTCFHTRGVAVCCTVRGDLIRILNKLIKRKGKFDAIMVRNSSPAFAKTSTQYWL